MIAPVDNVNFKSRWFGYSTHTPKMRPYRYAEFMPKPQKKNLIKEYFKKMIDDIKGIREAMKPDETEVIK